MGAKYRPSIGVDFYQIDVAGFEKGNSILIPRGIIAKCSLARDSMSRALILRAKRMRQANETIRCMLGTLIKWEQFVNP